MQCDGMGYCLTVRNLICTYECTPRECPNFLVCGNTEPQFILEFNRGVCNACTVSFGPNWENDAPSNPILEVDYTYHADADCPVCLLAKTPRIKNPRCSHYLCIACIRLIYGLDGLPEGQPPFPGPEPTEEEYYARPNWFINDPLVQDWKRRMGSWNEERMRYVLTHSQYLKHCPLCRR